MRCGCPQCGTYMIQSEGIDFGCVSREDLRNLTFVDHTAEHEAQEEAGDGRREPLRPEDFID